LGEIHRGGRLGATFSFIARADLIFAASAADKLFDLAAGQTDQSAG